MSGGGDVGEDAGAAVVRLLASRAPGATLCPSEVARVLAADWREAMPAVHAAVDALVAAGAVRLSWKGVALTARDGPYRIGRAQGQGVAAGWPGANSIRSHRLP